MSDNNHAKITKKPTTAKKSSGELCISVNTVATHRRNIFAKLGIHSSAGLAIFAIINHLIDIDEVAQGL